MDVLINEFSFSGQAQSSQNATELMIQLKEVLETIAPMLGEGKRYVRRNVLPTQMLYQGLTVREWINRGSNVTKDLRTFYLVVIGNNPDIEALLFDVAPNHLCTFQGNNVAFSSIAGGAHLDGVLACLDQSPEFSTDSIQVEYSPDASQVVQKNVATIFTAQQVWRNYRPRYAPSSKHAPGGQGTFMDLNDRVAQSVLDQGVAAGKQIYGYHNGKYYEFQNDNAGGFHGYPVGEMELPISVKEKFRARGIIQ
jgi:hypothetical protein